MLTTISAVGIYLGWRVKLWSLARTDVWAVCILWSTGYLYPLAWGGWMAGTYAHASLQCPCSLIPMTHQSRTCSAVATTFSVTTGVYVWVRNSKEDASWRCRLHYAETDLAETHSHTCIWIQACVCRERYVTLFRNNSAHTAVFHYFGKPSTDEMLPETLTN